jgi:hypothetical protein
MEVKPARLAAFRKSFRRRGKALIRRFARRQALGWTLAILVLACFATALVAAAVVLASGLTVDQKLVAMGDTFTIGAFTLAVIGAVVALMAYRLAIQRPVLGVRIDVPDLDGQVIRVGLGRPDDTGERRIFLLPGFGKHGNSVPVHISVENTSDWSARNTAVRVDFEGVRGVIQPQDWRIAAYHSDVTNEVIALQWEGGADYAVHGHWARDLPDLFLNEAVVQAPGQNCALVVDVVAEGFRKAWRFPIKTEPQVEMYDRQRGAIAGYCGYPSTVVPRSLVFAIPLAVDVLPRVTETIVGFGLRWFWIDGLDPGLYHVIAYRIDRQEHRGAYTVGARDDDPNRDYGSHPTSGRSQVKASWRRIFESQTGIQWDKLPPPPPKALGFGARGSFTTYTFPHRPSR